ncbi:MAG: M15 family metallopeptidase [Flavobacteriales bacterium]
MRVAVKYYVLIFSLLLFSCETNIENKVGNEIQNSETIEKSVMDTTSVIDSIVKEKRKPKQKKLITYDSLSLEEYLIQFGLVDIQSIEPQIKVDLKYSTTDNFVGVDLYGELNKAYCQPDMAVKLKKAYEYLQKEDSSLTLLVFDAVRPKSVQQKMWDTLKLPIREKTKFLSNPKNHSIHNYGVAVDISLSTKEGEELDMGTTFDYIGVLAHPREEQKLLKQGKLTQKQIENRKLLRKVMKKAGFFNIQTEWWHWNSCNRSTAKRKYKLVR